MNHGLTPSHGARVWTANLELVSHSGEFLPYFGWYSGFDHDLTAMPSAHCEARILQCLLDVHPVIHQVGDKLGVGHRLIGAPHDTEANVLIPIFHECRNDGMKRTLPWRQN